MAIIPSVPTVGLPFNSKWVALLADPVSSQIIFMVGSVAAPPPVTAGAFSPGCIAITTAGSSASTSIYGNSGTAASPTWTIITIS